MNMLKPYLQLKVRVQLVRDSPVSPMIKVECPDDIFNLLKDEVTKWDRERFLSIMLNSRNFIIGIETVSIGTLNSTVIHPREVFKSAILSNASAIILVHNHPSEDPSPSEEDKKITEQLKSAAKILDISLIDHIIITSHNYVCISKDWIPKVEINP